MKKNLELSKEEKEYNKKFFEAVFLNPLLKSYENKRVRTEKFIYQPPYFQIKIISDGRKTLDHTIIWAVKNIYGFGREK